MACLKIVIKLLLKAFTWSN